MKTLIASRSRNFSVVSPPRSRSSPSTVCVVRRVDYDRDRLIILGSGAQHRGTADINLFDRFHELDAGLRDRGFERIKIDHKKVDCLDAVLARRGLVLLVAAKVEQRTVHFRMQRLYPAIEHFGEPGKIGNVADVDSRLPQETRCAASGNNFHALFFELACEIGHASFVGNGDESALDFHEDFRRTKTQAIAYMTTPKASDKPRERAKLGRLSTPGSPA